MARSRQAVLFLVSALVIVGFGVSASDLYPGPSTYDYLAVSNYAQPLIASGAALPLTASASIGELFLLTAVGEPSLWRREDNGGATWTRIVGGSGGGGTTDHSALSNLAFADSAHTGFASESEVNTVSAALATATAALATVTADLSTHTADRIDPHGATMTVSVGMTVGSGTPDCNVYAAGSGSVGIASYFFLAPETATPSDPASMTFWHDANTNKVRVWDGAAWNDLW